MGLLKYKDFLYDSKPMPIPAPDYRFFRYRLQRLDFIFLKNLFFFFVTLLTFVSLEVWYFADMLSILTMSSFSQDTNRNDTINTKTKRIIYLLLWTDRYPANLSPFSLKKSILVSFIWVDSKKSIPIVPISLPVPKSKRPRI